MTRENFKITYGDKTTIKHKWNASKKEVVKIMREIAIAEQTIYELVKHTAIKEDFYFIAGRETWQGRNGKTVEFLIQKI